MNIQDFLGLFKDPLFVSIPSSGGYVLHSKQLENIQAQNTDAIKAGSYFTVNGFANFVEGEYREVK